MSLELRLQSLFKGLFPDDNLDFNNEIESKNLSSWDSIKYIILALGLEEEFNIKFTASEILELYSYTNILKLLENRGFN